MTRLHYLLLTLFVALGLSCKQKDITPSWLKINKFTLTTNVATEGENSQNITDAWLYIDNQPLGVFELPCKIPILAEGKHAFTIWAGIKNNGISDKRVRYPFYQKWQSEVTLVKNDTVQIYPTTTYKADLVFPLMEDFEDSGIDFAPDPISDTPFVFIQTAEYPDIVKWGNKCGAVFLTSTDSVFKAATSMNLQLPAGQPVYMEADFLNTNSMAMGVIAENSSGVATHGPLVLMNKPNDGVPKWTKIYIALQEDISYEVNATGFEVYLLGILEQELSEGYIYMDNIKIVHY